MKLNIKQIKSYANLLRIDDKSYSCAKTSIDYEKFQSMPAWKLIPYVFEFKFGTKYFLEKEKNKFFWFDTNTIKYLCEKDNKLYWAAIIGYNIKLFDSIEEALELLEIEDDKYYIKINGK